MKKSTWKISIDDGHVEYEFIVKISDQECIASVYDQIRQLFKDRIHAGKRRKADAD